MYMLLRKIKIHLTTVCCSFHFDVRANASVFFFTAATAWVQCLSKKKCNSKHINAFVSPLILLQLKLVSFVAVRNAK